MTISSTTNKISYTGNSSTTVFPYTFRIDDDDDIRVILITTATGVGVVQTKTTHYTVSGVGASAGGNITMLTAPTSAQKLLLVRSNQPLTQEVDYEEYSAFPASTHEAALDKLTMADQQQQEQIDRSIKVPQNLEITDGTIPDASIVAGQMVAINSAADGITTVAWDDVVDYTDVTTATPDSTDYLLYQDSSSGELHRVTVEDAINVATSSITALSNVGTGTGVYKGMNGLTAELKTLLSANTDLTLTSNTNDVTITVADHYLRNDGDVGTGVYDFGDATSLEIPNSTAPSLAGTGQLALDTLVTDFTDGVLKFTSGGNTYGIIAMPIAQFSSPTNNYVPVYNSTADQWNLAAQAGASGGTPGGSNNDIQFNSSGAFGGESGFTRQSSGAYTITSSLTVGGNTTAAGKLILLEDSDNGSNKITVTTPSSLSTDYTFTLPAADCTVSTFGASLMDDADASAGRTTLGLGTIATQAANSVSITGGSVTGITDVVVADGGTGLSSATAYAVLCGGTTSTGAFQSIAGVGTAGQRLTSNGAGALPTFQTDTQYIKAWINFDGSGTPTARQSLNISSITDGGAGIYTLNFTSALTSTTSGVFIDSGGFSTQSKIHSNNPAGAAGSTSSVKVNTWWDTSLADLAYVSVLVIEN